MGKYKCAGYYRLSKEDKLKKDESSSIESQRMIVESHCKYHKLDLIKEYVDDGYSGGNFNRPAFQEMIDDIETGKINCIITKDLSRLGREIYQTGELIEDYFNDKQVRYIAINDSFDSLQGDPMVTYKLAHNDYTLRDTSKKVTSSLRSKQKNGNYIGSYPKYGLMKDPDDHSKLIIDPVASVVVKDIFKMALNGLKPSEIADKLTRKKVPIPIVYKKEKRGLAITDNDGFGIWRTNTIRDMLKSQMYIGNMVQHTFEKPKIKEKKLRKVPEDEWEIVENTHDPIIDKETFERVNELLDVSAIKFREKNKSIPRNYLFKGLLYCKECGHTISIREKKQKSGNVHFTQCNLYTKKGKYGLCNSHRLNYDLLEEDLLHVIEDICEEYIKQYDNNSLMKDANRILTDELKELEERSKFLMVEESKYNNTLEQLYMDKVENKIPENIFNNLLNKYNENLKSIKSQKTQVEQETKDKLEKVKRLDYETCEIMVKKFLSSKKPKRSLIIELIDKVEIDNDKNITLYFNFDELTGFVN